MPAASGLQFHRGLGSAWAKPGLWQLQVKDMLQPAVGTMQHKLPTTQALA